MTTNPISFPGLTRELRSESGGAAFLENYEKSAGPLHADYRDDLFYKRSLAQFDLGLLFRLGKLCLPHCLEGSDMAELLIRSVLASVLWSYRLERADGGIRMGVFPSSDGDDLPAGEDDGFAFLDELLPYQVTRLLKDLLVEHLFLSGGVDGDGEGARERRAGRERFFMERIRELEETENLTEEASLFESGRADPLATMKDVEGWTHLMTCSMLSAWPSRAPRRTALMTAVRKLSPTLRRWLLTDIFLPMGDLKKMVADVASAPEDTVNAARMLRVRIEAIQEIRRGGDEKEVRDALLKRVREWAGLFGPVCYEDAASLARSWRVPYAYLQLQGGAVNLTLQDVRKVVDDEVLWPEEARMELSLAFYRHLRGMTPGDRPRLAFLDNPGNLGAFDTIEVPSDPSSVLERRRGREVGNNMLVKGSSGSGKTWSIRRLCDRFGLQLVVIHSNSLVQEGIVGPQIASYFVKGYTGPDRDLLRYAIVLFDEFDKLKDNEFGAAAANETLSIVDRPGEVVFNTGPGGFGEDVTLSTRHMTFFFTGVFDGIEKGGRVGFTQGDVDPSREWGRLTLEDFQRYGILPELIGRVGLIVSVPRPDEESVKAYLSGKNSPVPMYAALVAELGEKLILTPDGGAAIAERVARGDTGFRMADTLLNGIYRDYVFRERPVPGESPLVIDSDLVNRTKL